MGCRHFRDHAGFRHGRGTQELLALREDCPSRKLVPFEKHHRTAGMFLESLSSSRPCSETINICVSDACIVSFIHKPKSVSLAAFSSLSSKTIVVCFLHFYSLSCRCSTIRRFPNSGILRPNPALLSSLPCPFFPSLPFFPFFPSVPATLPALI